MSIITLESILELKSKHQFYHDFILYLQHTYCLENWLFYQDVQDYRSNPTPKKYQLVISRYIEVNSPHEINIPCDMRESLINSNSIQEDIFDEAAESILELIRVNSFLPWWYERQNSITCSITPPQFNNKRRNTLLTPSLSVPENRWHQLFTTGRSSFTSLRSITIEEKKKEERTTGGLFTRKRQALMYRVKKTFITTEQGGGGFSSWLTAAATTSKK